MSKNMKRTLMLIPVMLVLVIGIFGVSKVSAWVVTTGSSNMSHSEHVREAAEATEATMGENGSWEKNSQGKWIYTNEDGFLTTGFALINGELYHFNSDGVMTTGWLKIDGGQYYNTVWYYMGKNGQMQFGWIKLGNYWYYLSSNGCMENNSYMDGKYMFDKSGRWIPDTKWRKSSNGKWWYGYKDNYLYGNYFEVNGYLYRFDNNGYMRVGWYKESGYPESWFYANAKSDSSGPQGSLHSGWRKIEGKWYFLGESFNAYFDIVLDGKYYLGHSGAWIPDAKWRKSSNGKWWYGSGSNYLKSTLQTINGENYGFDSSGWMFGPGWHKTLNGWWVYATKSGALVNDGWKTINGKRYHFTNRYMDSNTEIDGIQLGPDGAAIE